MAHRLQVVYYGYALQEIVTRVGNDAQFPTRETNKGNKGNNRMKKTMMIAGAVALAGMVVGGCGSTKAKSDPVKDWQKTRFNAAEIKAAYTAKRALNIKDVMYKSKQEPLCAALGVPFNALAPVPAAIYLKVVIGVDELDAQLDGFDLVREMNDRTGKFMSAEDKAKAKKDGEWEKEEAVLSEWDKKDSDEKKQGSQAIARRARYERCCQSIRDSKTETLIPMIQDIIQVQIPNALADVQKTLTQVKSDLDAGKLKVDATGLALVSGIKCMAADASALSTQLKDAGVGAAYWLKLANEAKDFKAAFAALKNVK